MNDQRPASIRGRSIPPAKSRGVRCVSPAILSGGGVSWGDPPRIGSCAEISSRRGPLPIARFSPR